MLDDTYASKQAVTVNVGKARLIEDVSLAIPPRHPHHHLGANGAGKCTALSVLAEDLAASAGNALLDGRRCHPTRRTPWRPAARSSSSTRR